MNDVAKTGERSGEPAQRPAVSSTDVLPWCKANAVLMLHRLICFPSSLTHGRQNLRWGKDNRKEAYNIPYEVHLYVWKPEPFLVELQIEACC